MLQKVLWETERFSPKDPVWWIYGTAYTEEGDLIDIKYRIPDEQRAKVIRGEVADDLFAFPDDAIIRLDRQGNALNVVPTP